MSVLLLFCTALPALAHIVKNQDNSLTDTKTQLVWQVTDSTANSWPEALNTCENLVAADKDDWRLPSIRQLLSLVETGVMEPAADPLLNLGATEYWSSTSFHGGSTQSWSVNFQYGTENPASKDSVLAIRCVRGGVDPSLAINNSPFTMTAETASDGRTLLTWQKWDDNSARTFSAALDYCENLPLAGQTDWRLPNLRELATLTETSWYNPASDTILPMRPQAYWSGTSFHSSPGQAWGVDFYYGDEQDYSKDAEHWVRCVRGGPTEGDGQGNFRMVDNGDNTISDSITTLQWQKTVDGTTKDWQTGLTHCEDLELAGVTDWRMPNVRELVTLTDSRYVNPASVSVLQSRADSYWSSTANHGNHAEVWSVHFTYGTETTQLRTNQAYTRCVRGGPQPEDSQGISVGSILRDQGDGTMLDVYNSRVWQQQHVPTPATWQEAMQYCKDLALSSYDWRLPNIRELTTIADSRYHNPASAKILASKSEKYWSSSTYIDSDVPGTLFPKSWVVNFLYGNEESAEKTTTQLVRCVATASDSSLTTQDIYVYGGTTFTSIPIGQTSPPQRIIIGNVGTGPLTMGTLSLTGSYTDRFTIEVDTCSANEIAAGTDCYVDLSYTPNSDKMRKVTLNLPSNDPDSPLVMVDIVGKDPLLPGKIEVLPNRLDFFGIELGQSSTPKTLLIKNTGEQNINIGTAALSGGDAALYAIITDTCSANTLAPDAFCSIQLQFTPNSDGFKSAVLLLPNNLGPDHQVPLSGYGGTMAGVISGRVTDTAGNGIVGVSVYLYTTIETIHDPAQATAGPVLTDSYGFYHFSGVTPQYYVVAPNQSGNLYYPQFTDPGTSITSSFRQVELMTGEYGAMGVNFTTQKELPFVKLLFPRSGDKLVGDFGLFGTAFRFIGSCSSCSNIEKLEILLGGVPVLQGTLLGTKSDRFALSQIIWRTPSGIPVATTESYGWQDLFTAAGIAENQWLSLQVRAINSSGDEGFSQAIWIAKGQAGTSNVTVNLDAQQPIAANDESHTINFTADQGLGSPTWYSYQCDNPIERHNRIEYDQRTSLANQITYTMEAEDIWPVAVALRDSAGNTVVDIEQIISYKPARYGHPEKNGSGSRMAAMGTNVASGNFFHQTVDMSLEGVGIPFILSRSYNSLGAGNFSWMGKGGWAHNFDRAIFIGKSGRRLYLMQPDGHAERYGFVNGRWQSMTPGGYGVIVEHYGSTLEEFSFTVYDRSNTRYLYKWMPRSDTGDWRLVSITDVNDNSLTLTYSPTDGYLSKVVDTRDREIIFNYYNDDSSPDYGMLKEVVENFDTSPRKVKYRYNSDGRLDRFTDRRGENWFYSYDGDGRLASIRDPFSITHVRNTYDSGSGWIKTQTDGLDNVWHIAYNIDGNSGKLLDTTVTDPANNWNKYVLSSETGLVESVTNSIGEETDPTFIDITDKQRSQDTSLVAESKNPRGYSSSYSYADSGSGNLTGIQNPVGLTTQTSYGEDRTTQNQNLVDKVNLPGVSTPYDFDYYQNNSKNLKQFTDPEGAVVKYTYNNRGQVTQTVSPLGLTTDYTYIDNYLRKVTQSYYHNTNLVIENSSMTYDTKGRLASVTDFNNDTVEYAYNKVDQVNRKYYDFDPDTAGVDEFQYSYRDNGSLRWTIDFMGNKVRYQYNAAGLVERVEYFTSNTNYIYTETTYDELLRPKESINFRRLTATSDYDDLNKIHSVSNPLGESLRTRLDKNGNPVWKEWQDNNGKVLKTITSSYDDADRLKQSNVIMGMDQPLVTSYTYDSQTGYLKTITNPRGVVTEYLEHDKVGRPTRIRQDNGGLSVETRATYDKEGNLTSVTDPLNNITRYTYDTKSRLTSKEDHRGNSWLYTYDSNGNMLTSTSPDQLTTIYEYHPYGRLKSVTYADGKQVVYSWDENGNLATMDDVSMKADWQVTSHTYDFLNRLTERIDCFDQKVQYGYDDTNGINTITYPDFATPDDRMVSYTFDDAGRVSAVTDWLGNVTQYGYNGMGQIDMVTNENNTQVVIDYDDAGRLTDYMNSRNSVEFAGYHYTLDKNGNRTKATITQPLLHDFLDGNISYGIPNSLNQLTAMSGGSAFDYDDRGNLRSMTLNGKKETFTYDTRDLLNYYRSDADQNDYYHYYYSGSGDRVETRQGVSEVEQSRYILDVNNGLSKVLLRTDENDQVHDYFVYGPAGLISKITTDNKTYTYHYDPSGNTVGLSDENGSLTNSYAYSPYGQTTLNEGVENPFQYVGQYGVMAENNGLSFMRARFYHPALRRFISQDKIWGSVGNSKSLNLYSYVQGNPIMAIDPSGYMPKSWRKNYDTFMNVMNFNAKTFEWAGNNQGSVSGQKVAKGAKGFGNFLAAFNILAQTVNEYDDSKERGDSKADTFYDTSTALFENTLYAECGVLGNAIGSWGGPAVSAGTGAGFAAGCEKGITTWQDEVVPYVENKVIPKIGQPIANSLNAHFNMLLYGKWDPNTGAFAPNNPHKLEKQRIKERLRNANLRAKENQRLRQKKANERIINALQPMMIEKSTELQSDVFGGSTMMDM